jgi:hypothetical protein
MTLPRKTSHRPDSSLSCASAALALLSLSTFAHHWCQACDCINETSRTTQSPSTWPPQPMAQLYVVSAFSGVVIDIGDTVTDVTPIYKGYLAHHLRNTRPSPASSQSSPSSLKSTPRMLRAVARQVWQTGLVRVPVDRIAVPEVEDEGVTDRPGTGNANTRPNLVTSSPVQSGQSPERRDLLHVEHTVDMTER